MRFRHLQHYIMAIMLGCALLLSLIFGVIAYHLIQRQALDQSVELTTNLIWAVNATASAAVFSGNETLGRDAIDGLLGNEAVYSVRLVGFADEQSKGMTLSGLNKAGGEGLDTITVALKSPFDEQQLGELSVQPNADWVKRNAMDSAVNMIVSLIVVIFSACLLTAQLLKWLLSKPLVKVVNQLQGIKPGGEERLNLPQHLKSNEIGLLVAEFNTMLDRIKQAILVERDLRQGMEVVQANLEKAKEVAEHATQAKSNFLATMSHEIRTPMNSILGFLELALEAPHSDKETRRHLQIANTSAKFLLQLINDILDVSKIESGKLELDKHSFDLAALLAEIRDLMEIKARESGLQLNLHCTEPLAASYIADPYRLRQILINLVGNAIKFTAKGSVDIVVKRISNNGRTSHHGNCYEFSINDTGIGIAQDKIAQILQPFTQVDASITRQFGGTGLGTTISAELVQLMGGELQIQSTLGKGSRFYFRIELEPTTQVAPIENQSNIGYQQSKALHILLVDDVMENILLAKIHLEKAGHSVEMAQNGLEAVAATLAQPFDLVLMDIQMPEMDGYDATRAIRQQAEHQGHNRTMPIVAMTANAMKEVITEVTAAGMDEFIVKPIDFSHFFETINKVTKNNTSVVQRPTGAIETSMTQVVLPLIDFDAGLISWLDENAFYTALHGFADRNQETISELCASIGVGDVKQTDALVHKVKGAAGNLRLKRLYHSSCQLETSVNKGQSDTINAALKPFVQILTETLEVIGNLPLTTVENNTGTRPESMTAEQLEQCAQCLTAALDACERHDPDAAEAAAERLAEYIDHDQLLEINHKLQQFDFDAALVSLNQLAETLALQVSTS